MFYLVQLIFVSRPSDGHTYQKLVNEQKMPICKQSFDFIIFLIKKFCPKACKAIVSRWQ